MNYTVDDWAEALDLRKRGRERVGSCPLCGGDDRFHVRQGRSGDAIVGCRGCIDRESESVKKARFGEIMRTVFPQNGARRYGEPVNRPRPRQDTRTGATRPGKAAQGRSGPTDTQTRDYAARLWHVSEEISLDAQHPARRWLFNRKRSGPGPSLWWGECQPPPVVRFLPAFPTDGYPFRGTPPRCHALIVAMAAPHDWQAAWPDVPAPRAVQAICIDKAGRAVQPWGADYPDKLSFGPTGGLCVVVGDPTPGDDLIIVEGLADALAVVARGFETVLTSVGKPRPAGPLFEYACRWGNVKLIADNDENREGQRAAYEMRKRLLMHTEARVVTLRDDPAAFAETHPLPVLDDPKDLQALATDLQGDGLPLWECYRRAALCLAPATEHEKENA